MRIAAATDRGLVRENNEDAFWFDSKLQAMALADGMGGHQGGEIASLLASQIFGMLCSMLLLRDHPTRPLAEAIPTIIPAIDRIVTMVGNKSVYLIGMGTTLVAAIYRDNELHLTHVGDSRAAFITLSDGRLSWLTRDDNYAEYLVGQGELTREEARRSTYRHRLTACLGCSVGEYEKLMDVHYIHLGWPEDTLLLLCSDGLLDGAGDDEIAAVCVSYDPDDLVGSCRRLVDLAISKGGRDNCTVLLAEK